VFKQRLLRRKLLVYPVTRGNDKFVGEVKKCDPPVADSIERPAALKTSAA